jgi:hypothetical protein
MEINKAIFFPLTPFHLVCSTILRNKLKHEFNLLIIDNNLFEDELVEQIKKSNQWTKIFILKKSFRYFSSLQSTKYLDELFSFTSNNVYDIFMFSPGINICNLIINKIGKNNKLFLCDDGIAPYYFKSDILEYWNQLIKKNKIQNLFLKVINFIIKNNYEINYFKNIKIIILNKCLSKLIVNEHIKINIEDAEKIAALREVSKYYLNLIPNITNIYKIVYFHSGNKDFDHYICSCLLKKYTNQEIFHCFRQRIKTDNYLLSNSNNNNVPWEILHYKYINNFKESILVSSNLTTAFIDTINPYIGNNKRIIINKGYSQKLPLFEDIQNLINQNSEMPLCVINTFDEL